MAQEDSSKQTPLGVDSEFKADAGLMLSDILTVQTSLSIFYSYARETQVGKRLQDETEMITVFAPTNEAVMALAHKPHQGPDPVQDGTIISQEDFDSLSKENVERWIKAHIVPQHIPRLYPTSQYEALLEGIVITVGDSDPKATKEFEDKPDWSHIVLNNNIHVVDRVEAENGVLYLVDRAIYG
ncbi:hypothetical protein EW145_g6701 [Phellinidium pouzarii]|uniref:FAS1 domain-containing protein n=1 Tax=Phellinidium pouzarii TaxID=167371 RepID=A0A4S4KVH7_9AGAM|nr:hypothetical protein EW145_g6701 [Phellinidium pouzarii]